jgi:hypothetical protein
LLATSICNLPQATGRLPCDPHNLGDDGIPRSRAGGVLGPRRRKSRNDKRPRQRKKTKRKGAAARTPAPGLKSRRRGFFEIAIGIHHSNGEFVGELDFVFDAV